MSPSKHRRRRGPATSDHVPAAAADLSTFLALVDHAPTGASDGRESSDALDPVQPYRPADASASTGPYWPEPRPLTEEDLDDSVFFRRRERHGSPRHRHKDQQLAAQVAAIIGAALATLDDPRLASLIVASAAPAPDASRMLVTVVDLDGDAGPLDELLARLHRVRGALRAEVAAGITRKRAPELTFAVVPDTASTSAADDEGSP